MPSCTHCSSLNCCVQGGSSASLRSVFELVLTSVGGDPFLQAYQVKIFYINILLAG